MQQVGERFDLSLVVRFGSTATGRERDGSDVDVAVWTTRPYRDRGEEFLGELEAALDEVIEDERELDVVLLNDADPVLLFEVASTGQCLYEQTPVSFIEFRSWAARVYDDTEKFRRANRAWLEERLG
jgi:predicted nucleotidyltransferase